MENVIGLIGVKYGIKTSKAMCNVLGAKGLLEINNLVNKLSSSWNFSKDLIKKTVHVDFIITFYRLKSFAYNCQQGNSNVSSQHSLGYTYVDFP